MSATKEDVKTITVRVKRFKAACPECGKDFVGRGEKHARYILALHRFAKHDDKEN